MSLVVPFEKIFSAKTGLLSNHPYWVRVELGKVCSIVNGYPFQSSLFNKSKGFPIVRIRDLGKDTTETRYDGEVSEEVIIDDGDLLIGMDGNFRCCRWKGGKAGLNQRVCKLVPDERFLDRNFLLFGINGYLKAIQDATSSVTVGHLSSHDILRIPFPLPPLKDQKRIVMNLEKLLAKIETCQERLNIIPTLLKRFRQAVLGAAGSGRLTADWRGSDGYEDDMPTNWQATKLGNLASLVTSGSRGWAQYYSQKGAIFIRAQNINADYLDLSDIAYVDLPNRAEGLRTRVRKDDLLVTITGANVTKSAIVLEKLDNAYVSQHVALVRLKDTKLSRYIFYCLLSPAHGRAQLIESTYGQGKPGLNLDNIRNVSVWLPTGPERQEIVRRVEALFKIADQIEERYKKAKIHIEKLTQSILAKAFRGELVPQDPNDEPASALLERIHASKNGALSNRKPFHSRKARVKR